MNDRASKMQKGRIEPAVSGGSRRRLYVKNVVLGAEIGVHAHERKRTQPIRIDLSLEIEEPETAIDDDLSNVICYEDLVDGIKDIVGKRHFNLVETLAEEIMNMCLGDRRVISATVSVEKPQALTDAEGAGIELTRSRQV